MAAALDELERAAGLADKDAVAIPNPLLVVPKLTYSTVQWLLGASDNLGGYDYD